MSLFNLGAPSWLWEAINSLWLMLCKWIYIGINWFYQVFEKVASVNLFSTEVFKEITSRIYVIMGIAMLFIFAYNLVLMIINPEDKKGSGAMGKVIKETMISLVVVVLLPTIFNYMYIVQSHILESNIIGQIIMGSVGSTTGDRTNCDSDDYDCLCDFSKFEEFEQYNNTNIGWFWSSDYQTQGKTAVIKAECENYRGYNGSKITDSQRGAYSIAPTVFSAFYRPTNFTMEQCENYLVNNDTSVLKNDKDQKICVNYYFDVNMSKYTGNITPFVDDSYLNGIISDSSDKSMEFNWPFALIAGGLAVWMFICYAMEIGVRVAKLGLLQILSPIAVMMRVIPGQKEKIFDKWFTHLKNTYLDVFIRLVIIYFSLFAISLVPDVINTLWISNSGGDGNGFIKFLSMVVVILGILKFAQEAPALIKEFFGDSGRFALKSPKKQLQDNKLAKGVIGAAGTSASMLGKNMYDTIGNFKNKGFAGGLWATAKGMPRAIGQQITGTARGFKKGQDAQSLADMRDGIYSSAASELSKATLLQKAEGFFGENKDAFTGFYKANYTPYNSPAELRKASKLEEVAAKQKAFEQLLDNSDAVNGTNSYYEGLIKQYQNEGRSEEEMQQLRKNWREAVHRARAKAYQDKGADVDVQAALADYKEALGKNLAIVNEAIKENTKPGDTPNIIGNVDNYLSEANLSNEDLYKSTREAGTASDKSAKNIRQKAIQEEQKTKGSEKK